MCKGSYFQLRNIGLIRKYLSSDTAAQLVHAFVTSRLDYANSLLYGVPDIHLDKLQRVQNTAARVISLTRKYDHITPVLKSLHWLPVKLRIDFKILLLVFKIINDMAPSYLVSLISYKSHPRSLRSLTHNELVEPRSRLTTYGDRAFSIVAPPLWNKLPKDIRVSTSLVLFKKKLKTHLYRKF